MAIITTITNETCEGIQKEVELKKNNNYDSNYNITNVNMCVCVVRIFWFFNFHTYLKTMQWDLLLLLNRTKIV